MKIISSISMIFLFLFVCTATGQEKKIEGTYEVVSIEWSLKESYTEDGKPHFFKESFKGIEFHDATITFTPDGYTKSSGEVDYELTESSSDDETSVEIETRDLHQNGTYEWNGNYLTLDDGEVMKYKIVKQTNDSFSLLYEMKMDSDDEETTEYFMSMELRKK